jgi:hypothetical protein
VLEEVRWFPGARELVTQARAEMPQKNDLCGAFVTVVSLRANGIPVRDQDEAALAAGIRLAPDRVPTWPPGEKSRDDYRLALPRATGPAEAGASAGGVAHAIETLSAGRLRAVPASGDWGSAALATLGGTVSGPGGTVVSIVDSCPSLGDQGVHVQLLDRLALALRRENLATPGGLLLVVEAGEQETAEELVTSAGLAPCLWP